MDHELVTTTQAYPVPFREPSERPSPSAISQFLFVVFKWRRLILGLMLAFTIAALVVAVLKPPVRTATAKMLFKADRAGLQISGLSGASSRLPYSPQILQSEVELFRSRSVLGPVARELMAHQKTTPDEIDAKIDSLRANLLPTVIPDTNIIQLTYTDRTVEGARKTLNAILKHYMDAHAVAYRDAPAVVQFYEKETNQAADQLHQAEEALATWQAANNTVAIEPEIAGQLEKIATIQKNLNQAEGDIQSTQARIAATERLARAQPERALMMRERVPNPLIAKLQADVASAEVALKNAANTPLVGKLRADTVAAEVALEDLRRRYTDRDRLVVEKKKQVAMLHQELADAEKAAVAVAQDQLAQTRRELAAARADGNVAGRESVGPNPLRESLERDLATGRAQVTAFSSLRDTLRQQLAAAEDQLASLRDKKLGGARLDRAVAVAREAYMAHAKQLDDSRIAASLDQHHLADVAIVEPPYATDRGDLGRRFLVVVVACVVGIGVGVATAFTIEFFNHSVRSTEDVEFYVGLPVVATIPQLPGSAASLVFPKVKTLASAPGSDGA